MKSYSIFIVLLFSLFISSCASNKNKEETSETKPKIQAPISVGSILTKLEVVEYKSLDLPENQLRARVVEILGYGANTEILKTQSVLTLSFTNSDAFSSLINIEEGKVIEALITKSIPSMNSTSTASIWRIVELKNQ